MSSSTPARDLALLNATSPEHRLPISSPRAGGPAGDRLTIALLVVAMFLLRPNILGETLNVGGVAISVAAAVITLVRYRWQVRLAPHVAWPLVFASAASVWIVFRAQFNDLLTTDFVRGEVFTVVTLLSWALALSSPGVTRGFLKSLVWILVVMCLSQALTSALLLLPGGHPITYISFPVGIYEAAVSFPVTVDVGEIAINGINVPRFAGLGREPGWMSMYAALGWFIWPLIGRPRWWGRAALLLGVLAPISTSGFGIFIVVAAVEYLTRFRAARAPLAGYTRAVVSLVLLSGAAWLAVEAPVFGLAAKSTLSAESLDQRSASTQAGVEALRQFSLGAPLNLQSANVNLVATVASAGWPYALLIIGAVLLPIACSPYRIRILPSVLVVLLTLILAQPPDASPFVFVLLLALAAVRPLDIPTRTDPTQRTVSGQARLSRGRWRSRKPSSQRLAAS